MKLLTPHTFDPVACRNEWHNYTQLLAKPTLSERKDVQPFFKANLNLSCLIGNYFPRLRKTTVVDHEYGIQGDFVADLVVGDPTRNEYVLVEFEDGTPHSVFVKKGTKGTLEWAPRFEGAYSQLVDWLWKLEDMRHTNDFRHAFGNNSAQFMGIILIGKDMNLSVQEQNRLKWRLDRTTIDSNKISCVAFDALAKDFDDWLTIHYQV